MMILSTFLSIILYMNFVSSSEIEDSTKYYGKISQGHDVTKSDAYPYYISLQTSIGIRPNFCNDRIRYTQHCGGALIGKKIMITAAHCLLNATLVHSYRILPNLQNRAIVDEKVPTLRIQKYVVHPNFTLEEAPFSAHDIAIALLDREDNRPGAVLKLPTLPLNQNTKVKMMSLGASKSNDFPGKMQEASLLTHSDDKCLAELTWSAFSPDNNVCVSNDQGSVGCPTDSGSPLVWENPENRDTFIVGVLSNGLCHQSTYTVFVHVFPHLKFIEDTIHKLLG